MELSYAGWREDIMLLRALHGVHHEEAFYIDAGANSPVEDSVTKLFYDHGWHGINIEASPHVADAAGISKAHVWNLEKGVTGNPSMELVLKFAELFRVRVADLVGENPEGEEQPAKMVAMFRDLKQLDDRDRETIRMLMEQMKRRKDSGA